MDCIEKTGQELTTNNHDIVKYICDIEEERKTLDHIIQRQYEERKKVEAEIERLTYKLCLVCLLIIVSINLLMSKLSADQ